MFGPDQRAANMTDSKYFTTTKKGEIFELKSELNSDKKEKKKEAVKKVIASMTVGECCRVMSLSLMVIILGVCGWKEWEGFNVMIYGKN